MQLTISAILPAYNEEENIVDCVRAVIETFDRLGVPDWEVIVVDDGSTDSTSDMVKSTFGSDSRISIISHPKNLGYGRALRAGLGQARCEWIFITDSDLQFYIEELSLLVPHTDEYDVIQGYRANRADSAGRVFLGKLYRKIVHLLFQMPVRDPECSFRLINREVIQNMELICRGPMVPVELMYRAKKMDARFFEVAVSHRKRRAGEANALTLMAIRKLAVDFFLLIWVAVVDSKRT